MTAEMRLALKQAVDAAVRQREAHSHARTHCAGCGVPLDRYLDDCRTCWNRRYNRERYRRAA